MKAISARRWVIFCQFTFINNVKSQSSVEIVIELKQSVQIRREVYARCQSKLRPFLILRIVGWAHRNLSLGLRNLYGEIAFHFDVKLLILLPSMTWAKRGRLLLLWGLRASKSDANTIRFGMKEVGLPRMQKLFYF